MKALITVFALVVSLFAHELQYEHTLNQALQKAKQQNKEVMMMYSAVWCPECNYMKEVVLKDSKVVNYIQKRYVVLILDIQNDELPKGFDYIGIPTFFIVDAQAKLKHKINGGNKASKFLKQLKALG